MITNAGSLERYKTTCNAAHAIAAHPHSSTEACSRNASPVSALPRDFLEFFDLRRRARRTGCAIEIEDVDPSARRPSLTRTSGSRYGPARASRFPASGRSARPRRCRRVKFFRGITGTGSNGIIRPTFTVENTSRCASICKRGVKHLREYHPGPSTKNREPRFERPPRDVSLRRTSWLTPRRRVTRAVDPLRPRPRASIVSLGPKDRRLGPRAVAGRPSRRARGRRDEALLFSRRPSGTPTARERRRPRRADASMTKVPRRDVSETDRGGSIRAAAPGAEILKITTRSSHSPVSRSDARWLAREKNARVTTRDRALTPPSPILLDADTSGDSSDTIFNDSLTDDAAWPPPRGRAKVRAHSASESNRRDLEAAR